MNNSGNNVNIDSIIILRDLITFVNEKRKLNKDKYNLIYKSNLRFVRRLSKMTDKNCRSD